MTPEAWTAIGAVVGAPLGVLAAWLALRGKLAETKVAATTQADSAQDRLIDQLQQELERYRERTDKRLDQLELENRGYRAFIGVQRDHMAEHGIPLPPWPADLPR